MRRGESNECAPKWAVVAMLAVLPGCSFLTPGFDTRQAAEQRTRTSWDSESNLMIDESSTHNKRTLMAENGEGDETIDATFFDDGTFKTVKGARQILAQASEPKDVMQQLIRRDEQNAKVAERMMGTVEAALTLVGLRMQLKSAEAMASPSGQPSVLDEFKLMIRDVVRAELKAATQPAQ